MSNVKTKVTHLYYIEESIATDFWISRRSPTLARSKNGRGENVHSIDYNIRLWTVTAPSRHHTTNINRSVDFHPKASIIPALFKLMIVL